jgi:hypothetical protein
MHKIEANPVSIPYISFVLYSRNDDYSGHMLEKLQTGMDILIGQLESRELESEILIVEWNYPLDRPALSEVLRFPSASHAVTVKMFRVGAAYHRPFKYSHLRPVHPTAAYNVGVRRSRGMFVLPKSQDSFYSEQLMDYLAGRPLSRDRLYRCLRCDVDPVVMNHREAGRREFLDACRRNVIFRYVRSSWTNCLGIPNLHTDACGDFLLMSRDYWLSIRGWYETMDVGALDTDSLVLHTAVGAGAEETMLPEECYVYKIDHDLLHDKRVSNITWNHWGAINLVMRKVGISKEAELSFRQWVNFPKRRISTVQGAVFDSWVRNFLARAQKWAQGIGPFYLNGPDWGLHGTELPECVPCRADWESSS